MRRCPVPPGGARTNHRGPRRRAGGQNPAREDRRSRPWSPTPSSFRRTLHAAYDPAVALEMVYTWVADVGVPAVAAAVVAADGIRNLRRAGDARPDSLFALASLTKPIVALAAMVAVEEGSIELDAPAGRHLPQYRSG